MKKSLFILLLICSITYSQDWSTLSTGTSQNLQSIHFPTASSGWAVGGSGTIIATTNSGINWSVQNSGFSGILNAVHFVNNSMGWAAGQTGTILFTSNGGNNWVIQPTPTTEILYGISFVNNSTGWVSGYYGTIIKTTNAGVNWFSQNSSTYSYLRAIFFTDTNHGVATGYNGEIVKTTDGGNSWTEISFNATATLYSLYFINSNYGWAGGLGSQRTTNGGSSWSLMPGGYGTLGIYFTDINTGWEVGFNQIYYTINSGTNWTQYNLGFGGWLYSVYFTSSSTGYICGDYGTVYKTTDGGGLFTTGIKSNSGEVLSSYKLYQNYPNPFNPTSNIKYQISKSSNVKLTVYDVLGHEVTTLVNGVYTPGTYNITFDASSYPTGIYFYKLSAGSFSESKKMLLIK